jgi:hypothetical protein
MYELYNRSDEMIKTGTAYHSAFLLLHSFHFLNNVYNPLAGVSNFIYFKKAFIAVTYCKVLPGKD